MMLSEEAGALIESTAKFEMQKAQLEIQKHQYQSMLTAIENEGIEQASLPSLSSAEDTVLASLGLKGIDLRRSLYLAYLPQRAGDPLVAHFLAFARAHAGGEARK